MKQTFILLILLPSAKQSFYFTNSIDFLKCQLLEFFNCKSTGWGGCCSFQLEFLLLGDLAGIPLPDFLAAQDTLPFGLFNEVLVLVTVQAIIPQVRHQRVHFHMSWVVTYDVWPLVHWFCAKQLDYLHRLGISRPNNFAEDPIAQLVHSFGIVGSNIGQIYILCHVSSFFEISINRV